MKQIPLSSSKFALVDDADFATVSQFGWSAAKVGRHWYALRTVKGPDGKDTSISMHGLLMGSKERCRVAHKNDNGLDNRRENLHFVTHSQNRLKARKNLGTAGKFKGVYKKGHRWVATINANKKLQYLGTFDTDVEAARAYDEAARRIHGKFARLNFPNTCSHEDMGFDP